ncbi:NADH dehydrogenase ubiquinone Fe-S protein 4 [Acinetobacter baumannii]
MQSGRAKTRDWRLEFDTSENRFVEPLMGWTGSTSTLGQFSLSFPTKEEAIA